MKVILVPTDFSEQADHALDAAYQLALKSRADIWLTHVLEYPGADDEFVTTTQLGQPLPIDWLRKAKEDVEEHLQTIIREKKLEGVHVEYHVKVGNPYRSITRELLTDKVDLIVMGSKGASGLKEILVGSNAERMVRFARCPVLIIKEKADLSAIRNIVYATALRDDEHTVVKVLAKFQQLFDAHVHILKVNTMANFLDDPFVYAKLREFARKCDLQNYTIHTYSDQSEEAGIIHFSEEINADLIALSTHSRRGIEHLLSGSIAEDVVNHAKRPIWTMSLKV